MTQMLRVNEPARELGVSEAWLRRAEGRKKIPKAHRDMNGWRVYSQEDIASLRKVLFPSSPAFDGTQESGHAPQG